MADKTKTIKSATDKELDELIFRLRKESEAQSLISEIKRRSGSGYMPYDYGQEISTEKPVESLYHFGILGMHWGRKKTGTNFKSQQKSASEEHIIARKQQIMGARNLSTKELQALTQRLQLEKQLKDLSPSTFKKGMSIVKEITTAGTTVASLYALSKTPLGQDIKKAVDNALTMATRADRAKWVL